jgi:cyclophilin family peptidyl-prolyl cis-trans isomerase
MEGDLSKVEKRARKKAARDERVAQAIAAQKRRRMILLGAILGVVAVLVGLALFTGGDEEAAVADQCWSDSARTGNKSYNAPPEMLLEDGVDYTAVVATSEGDFTMDLLEEDTPETVNNFVCLARDGFYDDIIWHRVEKDQVIQTGDPEGTGQGGPGYEIPDELPQGGENPYTFGAVGMANAGPNTGGSQWFVIVKDPDPQGGFEPAGYPPSYTVFAKVDPEDEASKETLLAISNAEIQGGGGPTGTQPVEQIVIESIEIEES